MGFLSKTAEKAYGKASRRAYVPPWWRPLSYAVAGAGLGLVVLIGVMSSDDVATEDVTASAEAGPQVEVLIAPSGSATQQPQDQQATTSPATNPPASPAVASTSPSAATSTPPPGTVAVAARSGGTIFVPQAAEALARGAALALFTRDFSGVAIAQGMQAPTGGQRWPNARAGKALAAAELPGVGYSIDVEVDPDGAGTESVRSVTVFVVQQGNSYAYQPY